MGPNENLDNPPLELSVYISILAFYINTISTAPALASPRPLRVARPLLSLFGHKESFRGMTWLSSLNFAGLTTSYARA